MRPMWEGASRLLPDVARFRQGPFILQDDLERLTRVHQAQAPEASVLYCCRVLEFLTMDALRNVGLFAEKRVAFDLDTLHQFGLVPVATLAWAHALRRTGNAARHIRRRIEDNDADLGLAFLERWLTWYFCRFRYRSLLPGLTQDGRSLWPIDDELQALMAALEGTDTALEEVVKGVRIQGAGSALFSSATLPAVLAERILDGGNPHDALPILLPALERFDEDLRLQQLYGLYCSRTGDYEKALSVLKPLRLRHPHDPEDCETEGIVGGVFKRQGKLEECRKAYSAGWKGSGRSNLYLGINAATTALWLGRRDEARETAGEVRDRLLERLDTLARRGDRSDLILNYWDQATLAEAHLLLGDLTRAGEAYRLAFGHHPNVSNNHDVTRKQALKILDKLGLSSRATEVLG